MEFELRTGPQGHVYLPKKIRETFGTELTLLPNDCAGALFSKQTDIKKVIASLEVIIEQLKLRLKG